MPQEMTPGDVGQLLELFERLDLTVWIDGGWGVDALLGEQTREHSDLDIAIQSGDAQRLRRELAALGFGDVETDDRSEWNFVMGSRSGKHVDFHVIEIGADGRGVLGPADLGFFYPAAALLARGTIGGREVRCVSAEFQVRSRTGYELQPKDFSDVHALHRRFGVRLPPEYRGDAQREW